MEQLFHGSYATARKVVVAIVGSSVLLVGVALLVLPGPAFVVIPAGLAILAAEFAWARRWLKHVKDGSSRIWETLTGNGTSGDGSSKPASEHSSPSEEGPPENRRPFPNVS